MLLLSKSIQYQEHGRGAEVEKGRRLTARERGADLEMAAAPPWTPSGALWRSRRGTHACRRPQHRRPDGCDAVEPIVIARETLILRVLRLCGDLVDYAGVPLEPARVEMVSRAT